MAGSEQARFETEVKRVDTPARDLAPTPQVPQRPSGRPQPIVVGHRMEARDVKAWYGSSQALRGISVSFEANQVTALIGPSGCGKSTFVRCLNRMHEETPGGRVEGSITLDGHDIYASDADPVTVRSKIGM